MQSESNRFAPSLCITHDCNLKSIVSYTCSNYRGKDFIFFATTNGAMLNNEMKQWFCMHKNCFVLGLSLDGAKETHDANRSNSFDMIDFDFFLKN
jgi:sulfatase maturation enzyme AslB (radical SAM superfamily)